MRIMFFSQFLMVMTMAPAWAGVFNSVHFVEPGTFALGLEPDITLSNATGAATAINVRYTAPLSESKNLNLIVGSGGGTRRFRLGGNVTFDLFPNTDRQVGFGIAFQGIYYTLVDGSQIDLQAIPYLHNTFGDQKSVEIEPYFAFPIGMSFVNGRYEVTSLVSLGALFKGSETLRYVFEIGLAVNRADSYISGGIAYYP